MTNVGHDTCSQLHDMSGWSISCGAVDEPTTATFTIELSTQSSYTTYNVELAGKFDTIALSSSEESFGAPQVSIGGGGSFTDLAVGEQHQLPVRYTFLTTGSRHVKLTATIETGDWSWPDGESFLEEISVLVEEDGCTAPYTGEDITGDDNGSSAAVSMTLSVLAALWPLIAVLSL
jgi:hypothetical protein